MFYKLNLIKLLDPGGVLIHLSPCLVWCESNLPFFTCVKMLCLSSDETLISVTRWWGFNYEILKPYLYRMFCLDEQESSQCY